MAGEWIKMRTNLWDDPRVSKVCDMTKSKEAEVIGALYWLWSAADEHTEDGFMPGLSKAGIDRKTGIDGFGEAMLSIGWITENEGGVTICNFRDHNGTSAKRRATDAQRKATIRSMSACEADTFATNDGQDATECGAREEKRREEKNIKPLKSKAESATGSRLPADWVPTGEQIDFCKAMRSDLNPENVADRFRDYWTAQAGAKGRKADWNATWRNWVRNEKVIASSRASPGYQSPTEKARQWADRATGKASNESRAIIDIN